MRNDRIEATKEIAAQLFVAEKAMDEAISQAAKLCGMLPEARLRVKVSALMGHDTIRHAGESLTSLINARERMVSVHSGLDQVKTDIGLKTYAIGAGYPKPLPKSAVLLEVVSDAA